MTNTLAGIAIAVIAGMFVLYQANASLDFYGSIGFDMFDEKNKPFNGNDDDDLDTEEIEVIINTGKDKSKAGYPDFEVKAGSESETIYGKEFKKDGKGSTSIDVDEDTDRICISAEDVDFKSCKKIGSKDTITFDLRGDN